MHTEYYLLTVDVTVQGPVTLTAATQGRRKERLGPKQNPSQIETGFDICSVMPWGTVVMGRWGST